MIILTSNGIGGRCDSLGVFKVGCWICFYELRIIISKLKTYQFIVIPCEWCTMCKIVISWN